MRQKGFYLVALAAAMLFLVPPAFSNYKIVNGPKDFYFGHISYCEIKNDGKDPLVFREGQKSPEIALLNLPLGPGDTVKTSDSRRCEIQFDNGTIIRLDFNSELKIETILAKSLSTAKRLSNLLLARGQVMVMYKRYDSLEIFQIITPRAAVKLDHHAVALIEVTKEENTEVQLDKGKAKVLYGPDRFHLHEAKLQAKQRIHISAFHEIGPVAYVESSDFQAWNALINANFKELHEGNFLPKPVQTLPKAVFDWAQRYGNWYGEWIWHDLYGYVWRPYYNDYYPWGGWRPYIYGNWAEFNNQLFWIPGEPWGWVPYHLGIWMWDKNKGWLWMPGSLFAPAWVVWEFYSGFYLWRPWTFYDWYSVWTYGSNYFWYGYQGTSPGHPYPPKQVLRSIRKDQLKKKGQPALPLPKELKKAYQATVSALKKSDENVIASLREMPRQAAAIKREDLPSPRFQEKVINLEQLSKQSEFSLSEKRLAARGMENPSRDALRTIQRSRAISEAGAVVIPLPARQKMPELTPLPETQFRPGKMRSSPSLAKLESLAAPPALRFRDWNPDVKIAAQLGVQISYSSRRNEIACPQLGLSSSTINPRMQLSEHAVSAMRSSGSSSSGTGTAGAAASAVRSGSSSASSRPSGGHQKEKN